jgi:hypothetical protein
MLAQIEQCKGKHAPQLIQQILAPLFPAVDQDFRVRLCAELMPRKFQALANFAVVIQLAIKDHRHIALFVPNRLMPAGQINDAQPPHPQRCSWHPRII